MLLYGALTFWASLDPQPDPSTRYEDWARFVTTDRYVLSHVFGSGLGLILAIFGTFALAFYLTRDWAGGLGPVGTVLSVLGTALFLFVGAVSAFAAPEEGQAYLAGIKGLVALPASFADTVLGLTFLAVIVLGLIGNVLLGLAVWHLAQMDRRAVGVEAGSGREALAVLRGGRRIDAVVTDHAMPGMTGALLAATLRKEFPALPVILASGYAELPPEVDDLIVARLNKPFFQNACGRLSPTAASPSRPTGPTTCAARSSRTSACARR